MHSRVLLAVLAVAAPIAADNLNLRAKDVPAVCTTICQSIVTLTDICDLDPEEVDTDEDKRKKLRLRDSHSKDKKNGEDDSDSDDEDDALEVNCICTNKSFDVAGMTALCASCIAQNEKTKNAASKIMSQCSFTSTTYAPTATALVAGIQVQATKPASLNGVTGISSGAPGKIALSTLGFAGVGLLMLFAL
ncbi:hypothetical protein GQ53DRAFT_817315 [Thozetella sp. PMI_491]|nr:hypothetical protein GQ53DRAFT_817315 [Thozetella sp. PMI_491]